MGTVRIIGGSSSTITNTTTNVTNNVIDTSVPFLLKVQKGQVPGNKIQPFVARKIGLGVTMADIGSIGGILTLPSLAGPITVISTSILDTITGTGGQVVFVEGLDANFNEISEVIVLNGTSSVLSTKSFIRIHKATLVSAGSLGSNQGLINLSIGGVINSAIQIGDNVSYNPHYTIPNKKTGFILKAFVSSGKNAAGHVGLWVRPLATGVYQEAFQTDVFETFAFADFEYNAVFPPKTDLVIRGKNIGAGVIDMFAYYALLIVDDGA